jgi:hypothetical protein
MNLNPRTKCPYTLKPLVELDKINAEHVIPDALGCPKSYAVEADALTNSTFGSTVDANFLNDFLMGMLRSHHGVKSRSGVAKLIAKGTTVHDNHPVQITIPHNGPVGIHFSKPFIPHEDGTGGRLIAGADWEDKSAELIKNFAKKGKTLTLGSRENMPTTEVHMPATVNLTHLKVGLMKIAYLAAFEYIGNPFLDDPLNEEWQKAIRATDMEQVEGIGIHGACHDSADEVLKGILPNIEPHQHAVVVLNLEQTGPIVGVRLFGSPLLSLFCKLSESGNFGMGKVQGKMVICDSIAKSIEVSAWEDFVLRKCGIDPTTTQF